MRRRSRFVLLVGHGLVACGQLLADLAGTAAYWLFPRYRRALASNLAWVLGKPADAPVVRRAVEQAFRASARNFLALAWLRVAGRFWSPSLEITGVEGLSADAGGPVVVVSAHLGPFDVVAALLGRRGRAFLVVAEPMRPGWLDRAVRWLRGHRGVTLVPPSPAGLRRVVRALQAGVPVVFLLDRRSQRNGRCVRFFGKPVTLSDAPVRLARRFGCPLVFAFTVRERHGYRLRFEELIRPGHAQNARSDEFEQLIASLERAIRSAPDQWLVFRPLWSTEATA